MIVPKYVIHAAKLFRNYNQKPLSDNHKYSFQTQLPIAGVSPKDRVSEWENPFKQLWQQVLKIDFLSEIPIEKGNPKIDIYVEPNSISSTGRQADPLFDLAILHKPAYEALEIRYEQAVESGNQSEQKKLLRELQNNPYAQYLEAMHGD